MPKGTGVLLPLCSLGSGYTSGLAGLRADDTDIDVDQRIAVNMGDK
ncbi:hypothetical protein [Aminobacter carboxidus]|uniref:Uncharacterized protein n=1 Tax=Aminobacter carboxidus TaxID=376165 RepID=A0ABR9GGL8_9HYPH|nr:hypothetical protein [Aminobacter carboxidus]MBE1202794.1 hypothetical protein [Aminobacter carboxidus]